MLILLGYVFVVVVVTNKNKDAISKIYKITVFYILNFVSYLMSWHLFHAIYMKGHYAFLFQKFFFSFLCDPDEQVNNDKEYYK